MTEQDEMQEREDLQAWIRHGRIGTGRGYQEEVERAKKIEAEQNPGAGAEPVTSVRLSRSSDKVGRTGGLSPTRRSPAASNGARGGEVDDAGYEDQGFQP